MFKSEIPLLQTLSVKQDYWEVKNTSPIIYNTKKLTVDGTVIGDTITIGDRWATFNAGALWGTSNCQIYLVALLPSGAGCFSPWRYSDHQLFWGHYYC